MRTARAPSRGAIFPLVFVMVIGASVVHVPPVLAIRPFQIADDADAEDPGYWELEFGIVVERRRTADPKKTVIELPGELDLDYGLPWNAEIGFDLRTHIEAGGGLTLVDPVSELAIFYKQEFTTWTLDRLDVQTAGEMGLDFPTSRERSKAGKPFLPMALALSLWDIGDLLSLHFLVEGEIEELAGRNDLKLAAGAFVEYPLPFSPRVRLVAEYGAEKVEHEPRRHLVLGGMDWTDPFGVKRFIGGQEVEFDVAPFCWFTEGKSRGDWGVTAGFEWVWR